jgi:hypothetical protein
VGCLLGAKQRKNRQPGERALTTLYHDHLFKNHTTLPLSEGKQGNFSEKHQSFLEARHQDALAAFGLGSPSSYKTGSVSLDAPSIFGSFQSTDAFWILPAPLPCQCVCVGIIGTDLFWSHHRTFTPVTLPSSLSFAFPIQFAFYHIDYRYDHRFGLPPYFLDKLLRCSEQTRLKA